MYINKCNFVFNHSKVENKKLFCVPLVVNALLARYCVPFSDAVAFASYLVKGVRFGKVDPVAEGAKSFELTVLDVFALINSTLILSMNGGNVQVKSAESCDTFSTFSSAVRICIEINYLIWHMTLERRYYDVVLPS